MQDVKVTAWTLGSEQILWVGTDGNGLIKIYPKTKSFGTVITTENGMSYNSSVRAFCEENGNLWLGTKGNGIMKIPGFKVTNPVNPGKQYFQSPRELDNNSVFALTKGADDRIYIGTDGDGLGVYDQKYRKFYKWSDIKGTAHTAEFGSVYAILEDKDHSLWLGTSGYGLVHLVINRKSSGVLALGFLESCNYNN
jgi:ligand-binding sensor domain-containing protein